MLTYLKFTDQHINDAANHCDEIKHIPRVSEVILKLDVGTINECNGGIIMNSSKISKIYLWHLQYRINKNVFTSFILSS